MYIPKKGEFKTGSFKKMGSMEWNLIKKTCRL